MSSLKSVLRASVPDPSKLHKASLSWPARGSHCGRTKASICIVHYSMEVRPLILYGIEGHLLRCNDAVFKPALPSSARRSTLANQRTLVYFGGDLQNLSHLMDQNNDSDIDYKNWCLEETAMRLSHDFPSCHVVVIKPSRVMFDHISCFDNFVESNFIGIPKHYYHYVALLHLEKLLETISSTVRNTDPDILFKMLLRTRVKKKSHEAKKMKNGTSWQHLPADKKRMLEDWQKKLHLDKYPLTLVAFSKGCVVLNQFLYEFHYARGLEPNHQDSRFIERIRNIYWLDAGNCGPQNVYLTSVGLLRTLASLDLIVHVHVSMYMVEDVGRPWIGKQFNEFVNTLVALNGNILYFRHVSSTEDLEAHFNVLLKFKYAEERHKWSFNSPKVRKQIQLPPILDEPEPVKQPEKTISFRLVNPHSNPYLELEMALQKPGFNLRATQARLSCPLYRNFESIVPTRNPPRPSSQMPATSAGPLISDQTTHNRPQSTPVQTTSAQMPSTPVQTTSAQMPSTPMQTTSAQMPSTSMQTASAQMPSTPMQTTSAQMPSTPMQTTSAQMPSTPAEPVTSVQTPSPSVVWSSDLLPQSVHCTPLLLNELRYSLSEEEVVRYKNTAFTGFLAPVVAIPNQHNPLRLDVFTPVKDTYVPVVYNHHFVVDNNNENAEGEDLPAFFANEEPPDTDISDVSNPDSDISDSASDVSDLDSDISDSASDVSNTDSDISDSASHVSNPDPDISDSASHISNPDADISGTADDASASDSDNSSSGTSSPVNSRIGSRSGVGRILSNSSVIDVPYVDIFNSRAASGSGLGSHSTRVTQDRPVLSQRAIPRSAPTAQPNTVEDRPVLSQRTTSRSAPTAQPNVSQNQMVSSSHDSVARHAGPLGPRVRARDVDDEPSYRYNLRKRIKRSYDENILRIQYQ